MGAKPRAFMKSSPLFTETTRRATASARASTSDCCIIAGSSGRGLMSAPTDS